MHYLTLDEIVKLNELTVHRHGGHFVPPHNYLHGDALAYLVETVEAEMFGQPLYPDIADKAGLYMFNIISNHIFQDGNKRTGLAAALTFLLRNGHDIKQELDSIIIEGKTVPDKGTHKEMLYAFTIAVASGQVPLEACQQWFAANLIQP